VECRGSFDERAAHRAEVGPQEQARIRARRMRGLRVADSRRARGSECERESPAPRN
jgi:hypothetical protein